MFERQLFRYPKLPTPSRDDYGLMKCAVSLMLIISVSGCSTSRFTQTAGQFGKLTKSAAEQQNERLRSVEADELKRYRQELADKRTELRFSDCAQTLAVAAPDPAIPIPRCRVTERVAQGSFTELRSDVRFDNISALNSALDSYADGLVQLAADASKDEQAFVGSVSKLASSLGELDGAIKKVAGASAGDSNEKFSAVGALVAKLGSMYFAARRQAILKQIITESDPLVQRAVAILGDADSELDLYDRLPLYSALLEAQTAADEARAIGKVETIRLKQDKLFTAVENYNAYQIDRSRFAAIGQAHSKLVAAAEAGATLKELQGAIVAVLELASTIGETKSAFDGEKK